MNSIVSRIRTYLEHKKIAPSVAEKEIGSSNGSLSKPFKANTTIKTDMLEKFLTKYRDINYNWLLTGNGEMLLEEPPTFVRETSVNYEHTDVARIMTLMEKQLALLEENKELQAEKIKRLEKELTDIKRQKENESKASRTATKGVAHAKT